MANLGFLSNKSAPDYKRYETRNKKTDHVLFSPSLTNWSTNKGITLVLLEFFVSDYFLVFY